MNQYFYFRLWANKIAKSHRNSLCALNIKFIQTGITKTIDSYENSALLLQYMKINVIFLQNFASYKSIDGADCLLLGDLCARMISTCFTKKEWKQSDDQCNEKCKVRTDHQFLKYVVPTNSSPITLIRISFAVHRKQCLQDYEMKDKDFSKTFQVINKRRYFLRPHHFTICFVFLCVTDGRRWVLIDVVGIKR